MEMRYIFEMMTTNELLDLYCDPDMDMSDALIKELKSRIEK